jgi:hypothetical protein
MLFVEMHSNGLLVLREIGEREEGKREREER